MAVLSELKQDEVLTPTGVVKAYVGTTAPAGWRLCDGSLISRTTYARLYAVIGDAFGEGDGSTNFSLPDFRGRFLRGVDGGAGNDPDAGSRTASGTNGNTGDAVGSAQGDEMVGHSHFTGMDSVTSGSPSVSDGGGYLKGNSSVSGAFGRIASATTPFEVATRSNPTGNETRPKNVNVTYIIKF